MIVRESEREVLTVKVFERITESPEVLGKFLACDAENCDACPNEEFRNNPGWWLTLEAGAES